MLVIKRYLNRKLYDTEAKRYITLEGIAELIRQRKEVQVFDHVTGEDLTALTLSHIVVELARKRSGFLPHSVLTSLIRAGGDTLGTVRRGLASSSDLLRQVDGEIELRILCLIKRGELTDEEGDQLLKKLLSPSQQSCAGSWPNEQQLERLLAKRHVPTPDDLDKVNEQLEVLAEKIADLAERCNRVEMSA